MARYDVMVRCTVEAESVEAAETAASYVVGRLSNGHKFSAEVVFPDGEDNDGQRVYYLHPANVDADTYDQCFVDADTYDQCFKDDDKREREDKAEEEFHTRMQNR